ncbi:MAG: ferrous iron transport protein B [Anaerolineaceae bacterium]|nr:ferrous iron transport protein B [Anaerolineaceae bacterium]
MSSCHAVGQPQALSTNRIALIGNPNVGKSMLFHRLTGKYVTVSNYPGTTVEVTQGILKAYPNITVVDTPGIVTFPPRGEDEQVTTRVLLQDEIQTVLQVGDAKNLRRTLQLTVQLAEMGHPLVLALNMMDEASARGLKLNVAGIAAALDIAVVPTIATRGQGMDELVARLGQARRSGLTIAYPAAIEGALQRLEPLLPPAAVSARSLALLWLRGDQVSEEWLAARLEPEAMARLRQVRHELQQELGEFPLIAIQKVHNDYVDQLAQTALEETKSDQVNFAIWLSNLSTHPVFGLGILAVVLYVMYWFVGIFGAGTLVGFLEEHLFGQIINPWLVEKAYALIPVKFIADLLFGEYGLWTMGMTYALALLLPIVLTFFLMFGALEDSGYLPRLAVLTNRVFSWMGLNGQAVLPMVLGLGCVTMATMTTRILNNRRDRILVTLLLSLAIPCSAQLGVVMGMLASISLSAALIWAAIVLLVLILVGWLAARVMPGERTPLIVELPPLRWPVFSNVLQKTLARLEWYVIEAVPLFLLGTFLLFLLDKFSILPWLIEGTKPVVTGWLGLPADAAPAFLLGLMRRDFAATGLFAMQSAGLLDPVQVVVSIVTITLFIPCIASIFMIVKERGAKVAAGMVLFIFPFAILIGGLLQRLLVLVGWNG